MRNGEGGLAAGGTGLTEGWESRCVPCAQVQTWCRWELGALGRLLRPSCLGLGGLGGDPALTREVSLWADWERGLLGQWGKHLGQPFLRRPVCGVGSPWRTSEGEGVLLCLKQIRDLTRA